MKKKTNKIAVGYVRVVTRESTLSDDSIMDQKESIKKYCRKNSVKLRKIFEDIGVSGNDSHRAGLYQLFRFIRSNRVDMVVCSDLDRLSRNTFEYVVIKSELEKQGVNVVLSNKGCNQYPIHTSESMEEMLRIINSFMPKKR